MAESSVQAAARLHASQLGWRVWRNNSGVLINPETGRPIRFGLANDSRQLNAVYKSGDLIGCRPVLILPEHVGHTLGVFVSIECKHPDWTPRAGDERYQAQKRWADLISSMGGYAIITTTGELT